MKMLQKSETTQVCMLFSLFIIIQVALKGQFVVKAHEIYCSYFFFRLSLPRSESSKIQRQLITKELHTVD